MDLFKPKAFAGDWFPYGDDGQIKVRAIPGPKALELQIKHFGKRVQYESKKGSVYFDMPRGQNVEHAIECAAFALMDTKNIRCPMDVLPTLTPGPEDTNVLIDGMILLDGRLEDGIKTEILGLSEDLRAAVLRAEEGLKAKTLKEEDDLGKT